MILIINYYIQDILTKQINYNLEKFIGESLILIILILKILDSYI